MVSEVDGFVATDNGSYVLILVLVEDGIGDHECCFVNQMLVWVLILVLVEDGIGVSWGDLEFA